MDTSVIILTKDHGYVFLNAALVSFVAIWHTNNTYHLRKKAGIPYPETYAPKELAEKNLDAKRFNCAQRAHANFLEAFPAFIVPYFTASLMFPKTSAVLGLVWNIGRVAYTKGYSTGDPVKRNRGFFSFVPLFGLLGLNIYSAVQLLRGNVA